VAANKQRFGFQVSPQKTDGTLLGSLNATSQETQVTGGKYITHTQSGTAGNSGSKSWTFEWTAPTAGTGDVTFYGAFNIANGDNNTTGDEIWKSSLTISESGTSGIQANTLSQAKAYFNGKKELVLSFEGDNQTLTDIQLFDLSG